jgi:excisionase family DNA binding protein
MSINLKSPLLSNTEAANLLKICPETLAVWRSERRYSIPFIKVGRSVRYRLSDLETWLESRQEGRPR